jgi:hypothetical protein
MAEAAPFVPILIAVLAGGVAGGVAGRMSAPAPAPRTAKSAAAEPEDSQALGAKVAKLERDVAALERERRITRAALARALPSDSDPAAGADGGAPPRSIDDPVFELAVRDVMDQIDDERRQERQARWEERRKVAADRWSAWLGTELGLSDDQKRKVADVVKSYFEKMQATWQSDAGPVTRQERRSKMRELRTESDKQLAQILHPQQKAKYDGMDEDDKIGFGFGGGRRHGGQGGPGGPGP